MCNSISQELTFDIVETRNFSGVDIVQLEQGSSIENLLEDI